MRTIISHFIILLGLNSSVFASNLTNSTKLFSCQTTFRALLALIPGAGFFPRKTNHEKRDFKEMEIVYYPGHIHIVFDGRMYTFFKTIASRSEQKISNLKSMIGAENFGITTLRLSSSESEKLGDFFRLHRGKRWPMTCVNGVCWALAQADIARIPYPLSEFPLGTFFYFRMLHLIERYRELLGIHGDNRVASTSDPTMRALVKNPELQVTLLVLGSSAATASPWLSVPIRDGAAAISILGVAVVVGSRLGAVERYFSRAMFLDQD